MYCLRSRAYLYLSIFLSQTLCVKRLMIFDKGALSAVATHVLAVLVAISKYITLYVCTTIACSPV